MKLACTGFEFDEVKQRQRINTQAKLPKLEVAILLNPINAFLGCFLGKRPDAFGGFIYANDH